MTRKTGKAPKGGPAPEATAARRDSSTEARAKTPGRRRRRSKSPLIDHALMKALAHEDRVRCLAIFHERMASPSEMAEELRGGLSRIRYHVKVLHSQGLIELEDEAQRGSAIEHVYRATTR